MNAEKDIWLNYAKHKLTLLIEFDEHLLIPKSNLLMFLNNKNTKFYMTIN